MITLILLSALLQESDAQTPGQYDCKFRAQLQETPDDVIKALSDSSAVARGEAAAKIAKRGRKAIPLLRLAEEKASGDVRVEIRSVVASIGDAEVRELLKKEGHASLADLKSYSDEALTKVLPHASVHLLPGEPDCKACGTVERLAVVNVLADDKGAPAIVKTPTDVAKLFKTAANDEAGRRAVAAAALFVLRAMHPRAHTNEVIPRDDEAFADPAKLITFAAYDAGTRGTAEFKIGHGYYEARLDFDAKGALTAITLHDTGGRCK